MLLEASSPFSLSFTVQALRRLPGNVVDRLEDGVYWRAVRLPSGPHLVSARELRDEGGTAAALDVRLAPEAASSADLASAERLVRRLLGLDVDVGPFAAALAAEARLYPIVERLRGLRPPRFATLFETIGNVIPFQQVSLHAGMSLTRRLVHAYGERVTAGDREGWLFPEPGRIADASVDDLRRCGLSRSKAVTMRLLARDVVEGTLGEDQLERLPSAEAVAWLDELPGIGPWTASVMLLRGLGRLDVFPPGDSGARRTLGAMLGYARPLDQPEETALLARLGPWRGLLYFYTLGWHLAQRGLLEGEVA